MDARFNMEIDTNIPYVLKNKVSSLSMAEYNKYKNIIKDSIFVCPCSIHNGQMLYITDIISDDVVLIKYKHKNKTQISIIKLSDIVKCEE